MRKVRFGFDEAIGRLVNRVQRLGTGGVLSYQFLSTVKFLFRRNQSRYLPGYAE